ncbi:MAG: histidine phosphatase family protein [Aquiluna sp.]
MTETVLGLFRHGQTDWNIDLRLQGTADIPMNQFGIEQVQKAASEIARQEWDLIISSPLGRAKQSAAIIAAQLGVAEVTETPLLLERAFGIGEGMLYDEWSAKFAHLDEIPGAESAQQVTLRAEQLLGHVQSEFAGKRILAVSHGALIRFVLQVVTAGEIPPKGERLENASLNVIRRLQSWQLDQWAPKPLGS